ncbi:unnamed protein product [Camellia sinensis]
MKRRLRRVREKMSSGCSTSSSTRPVPRRESPWGTPEGDHRQPKAHRCNDRAEDVIQRRALMVTHLRQFPVLSSSSSNACAQNLEPTEPFYYLQLDPLAREVKLE